MVTRAEARSDPQLEVLPGISQVFGSTSDFGEIAAWASRWVRAAVGSPDAAVRIILPDGVGRLRVASTDREGSDVGRKRSARRRAAFQARTPVRLDLEGPSAESLAILPLVCAGESVGVLEVVAERGPIEDRWETLKAVAGQVAIALSNLRHQAQLRRDVETLGEAVSLGRLLLRASSPGDATREAVRFLSDRFQAPIAAWLPDKDAEQMVLVDVRGLGTRRRKELRTRAGILPRWDSLSTSRRSRLSSRFEEILGARHIEVVAAGDALLLAGEATPSLRVSLDFVGSLLEGVLRHLASVAQAERRDEELDLGIAWTAHEFRGPLMGVKAVLEFLLRDDEVSPGNQAMLQRSVRELEHLAGLVDGLLRWAVGTGALRRRQVDLVRLVEETVESCRLETGEDRIRLSAPRRVMVRIDAKHLRGAIANLIRNALAYSPSDSQVEVSIEEAERSVTVSVRDHGPGIPAAEREAIFDPFIRGGMARFSRSGKGLGLFITRRVVEAHDGEIWLESNGKGAAFHIQLPVENQRGSPSAS